MRRTVAWMAVALLAAAPFAAAQGQDANQVLAEAQKTMGGEKLSNLKSLTAKGRTLRTGPDGNTRENEFELSLQTPDKYLLRSVIAAMGSMSIYRNSGFNGEKAIEEIDQPPNLSTGGAVMMIRVAGPGGTAVDPNNMTPEQRAEFEKSRLMTNRREYAKLALGMFAAVPAVYPLTITYAGEAESPDGKADALDIKGEGFEARLFVDAQTHLPLMLTWMDKEPVVLQMGGPGRGGAPGGGGTTGLPSGGTWTASGSSGQVRVTQGAAPAGASQEERDRMRAEMEARMKEAEASRRTVEFRIYYGDYQEVGGILLPHRIQRSVDGKPTEEMVFDSFKINPKIDAKTFEPINK